MHYFFRKDQDLNGLTSGFCWSFVSFDVEPFEADEMVGFPGNFAFFLLFVHVEQYHTNLGSFTFSLAKLGL